MRAHKIQRRCSAVGFDWTSLGPVLDKVHEEIDEVMHEAQQAVVDEAKLEEEVGDLLFATVNYPVIWASKPRWRCRKQTSNLSVVSARSSVLSPPEARNDRRRPRYHGRSVAGSKTPETDL